VIGTTTNFFIKARNAFRGSPRAVPVAMPANVQTSSAQGLTPAQMGTPFVPIVAPPVPPTLTPVSLEKKPADLETIGLGSRASFITTPQIDAHGTAEEKIGPRAVPASLVGGL